MKNRRAQRQYERSVPFRQRQAASDEFWRKWHEPQKRREMLQRLADSLASLADKGECKT